MIRQRISEIVNGPGSCGGYRTIWHTLKLEGFGVPRRVVAALLKEIDPEGTENRRRHRLKRRQYNNPGPNFAWHIDGYDKLKPYGFPIHGGIDGFSRKILWLKVTRSNNSPNNIASMFLDSVEEHAGCPVDLISDLGTENGTAASIQSFFRDDIDAHRYVPSPRNQRIEGWWSFFSKNRSIWWRNFFADMESQGELDLSDQLSKECIFYCFSQLLQDDLNHLVEHWNTHRIRKSGNRTSGRPYSMYHIPERFGGTEMRQSVDTAKMEYVRQHIVSENEANSFTEYFDYVCRNLSLTRPTKWEEGLNLYRVLMRVAIESDDVTS